MADFLQVYRAVSPEAFSGERIPYRNTRRPPGNVPYLVDNLWEWARPEEYPNRRFAAFASPTPELACKAVGPGSRAYRVEFAGSYRLCQVKGYEDSKDHPEVKTLRRLLFQKFGRGWPSEPLHHKVNPDGSGCAGVGRLFIPCLTKDEVEQIFQENALLRNIRDEIHHAIRYWDVVRLLQPSEAVPDPRGEIFFEAYDGYYLRA
jgi:hypothetical protein